MRCGALRSLRRLVSAGMPRGSPGEMKRAVRTRPVHQPGARRGQYGDQAGGVEGDFSERVKTLSGTLTLDKRATYPYFLCMTIETEELLTFDTQQKPPALAEQMQGPW